MSRAPSRRALLAIAGGAAAAAVPIATVSAKPVPAPAVPDPAIAAFLVVQSATAAFEATADGPAADAAYDVFCDAIDRLVRARPTTIGGLLAKVAVARKRLADECDSDVDALLASLLDIEPSTIVTPGAAVEAVIRTRGARAGGNHG